ncbi:hypothetical protein B0H14DRAFT_3682987 [Mycena olivaceomarginata]|nr:hypothetical protein B0H14DRAFT_3682987 [Mycena olivaceomarginata]
MSARRQASTTSLAKYARGSDIGPHDRSVDFCNAFWGYADSGVDVLFARMRGAARTTDELRNFWKERAAIEDEYAKRLAKLAKQVLGRDEIGDCATPSTPSAPKPSAKRTTNLTLAQQVRGDLEAQTAAFHAKQTHTARTTSPAIEKSFKAKQTQESLRSEGAREGRDAERIHLKLERRAEAVGAERARLCEFREGAGGGRGAGGSRSGAYLRCVPGFRGGQAGVYEGQYVGVCERCVDGVSCEKCASHSNKWSPPKTWGLRARLRHGATRSPTPLCSSTSPIPTPSRARRPDPRFRAAEFARSSQRAAPLRRNSAQPEEDLEPTGEGGEYDGAWGRTRIADGRRSSTSSRRNNTNLNPASNSSSPTVFATPSPTTTTNGDVARQTYDRHENVPLAVVPRPPARPARGSRSIPTRIPSSRWARMRIGWILARDPTATQQQGRPVSQNVTGGANRGASPQGGPSGNSNGNAMDPLARQMEELAMQSQGTIRRNSRSRSVRRGAGDGSAQQAQNQHAAPQHQTRPSSSMSMSLAAPHHAAAQQQQQQRAPSPGRDYRYSADAVVGAHPSFSRPASPTPAPIPAAFMRPASAASAAGVGRPGSEIIARRADVLPAEPAGGAHDRQPRGSRRVELLVGGGGAGGRGRCRGTRIMRAGARRRATGRVWRGRTEPDGGMRTRTQGRASSRRRRASSSMNSRNGAASPNNLGIALDPSGRVIHDEMAQRYQQQQPPQQQQQRQSMAAPTSQGAYNQPQTARELHGAGDGDARPAARPPPQQPAYGAMTPVPAPAGLRPTAAAPAAVVHPRAYQAPPPRAAASSQVYQPQPHASAYQTVNGLQNGLQRGLCRRGSGGYYSDGRQQPATPAASAATRTVKALFDYRATIDEEFDFQEGDIIAVTATPEDGGGAASCWTTGGAFRGNIYSRVISSCVLRDGRYGYVRRAGLALQLKLCFSVGATSSSSEVENRGGSVRMERDHPKRQRSRTCAEASGFQNERDKIFGTILDRAQDDRGPPPGRKTCRCSSVEAGEGVTALASKRLEGSLKGGEAGEPWMETLVPE